MPFAYELQKFHKADKFRSEATTAEAKELQALYDKKPELYPAKLEQLKAKGHQFRLTDSNVYEIFEEKGNICDVIIKFQVKNSVITWTFLAPKDETYQEFRDILYTTAAEAHDKVEFGCERYYRGTNAYHLKKMHSYAGEASFNHNHYRRADGQDISPKEVAEHLRAFAEHKNGQFFFPDLREVEHIIDIFTKYWKEWNYQGSKRSMSLVDQYKTEKSQAFDDDDIQEEKEHLNDQEPCRVNVSDIPHAELIEMQLMRIRGIGSERAGLRQAEGSTLKTISASQVMKSDDRPAVASAASVSALPSVLTVSMFASVQAPSVTSSSNAPKEKQVLRSKL